MPVPVRRLTFGLLLGAAVVGGGNSPAPVAAQTTCESSYATLCISEEPE